MPLIAPGTALLTITAALYLLMVEANAMPNLPGFIENGGQLPPVVRYYAPLPAGIFYITSTGYGYVQWDTATPRQNHRVAYRIELSTSGKPATQLVASNMLPTVLRFYHGNSHIETVRIFQSIRLHELFPKIDAHIYWTPTGRIKCDYILAPGADPTALTFRISSVRAAIDGNGQLRYNTPLGTITEAAPIAIQGSTVIPSSYQWTGHHLSIKIEAPYDRTQPLVIDPEIEWSTFAGGTLSDQIAHVRTDRARNIYVLGRTQSLDFPTRLGYSTIHRGDYDAFIAKYSATGALLWATYYGGSRREIHNIDHCDLVVDGSGSILITGCTQSDDLPITSTAFQRTKGSSLPSGYDLFLAQFSTDGQLLWASFCGGNDNEDAYGLSQDRLGNIYLVGHTSSSNFPVTTPAPSIITSKPTFSQDVFVLKLSPQRQPVWVYFIGGNNLEYATDVVCDKSGGIYVCGYTQSADFPTVGSDIYQRIKTAKNDGYLFKLDGLGRLQWSTLLGGNGEDYCSSIAIDSSFDQRVIVGGTTSSSDMWYRGIEGRMLGGTSDGFIAALDSRTGAAHWVQYHGGSSYDELTAVAIDPDNNIIAVGRTLGDYPTKAAQQPRYNGGGGDMFVAKLGFDGATQWATYAGGTLLDRAADVAIDGNTNFVVVGFSASSDFPIVGTTAQPLLGNAPGIDDGVLIKFCNIAIPVAIISSKPEYCQGESRVLNALNRGSSVQYDSYQWELNGQPIDGATSASYQIPTTLDSGTYRFVCRVTNTARCPAFTDTIVVRIHARPTIEPRQFALCYGDPIRLDSIVINGTRPFRYQWIGDPPPSDPTIESPVVHPQQTTTYTLRITDANGCSAEQSFPVIVLPISQLPISIMGKHTFCDGDSTILKIPDNLGWIVWNTGEQSPQISVRTSGKYHARVRLPSGCEGSTDTVEIRVHLLPKPAITFDGTQLRTTAEYERYQWFLDGHPLPGATDRSLEPPRVGTYTVAVDSLGCSGISAPLDITLSAQTHLTVESATAAIGERVRIPIRLETSQQLERLGVYRLTLRLRFNASVLYLLSITGPGIERSSLEQSRGDTSTLTLTTTNLSSDTLVVLDFLTVWGNAESSRIAIETVEWGSPAVSTTWTDGNVQLLGFCRAGATRLFEDTEEFGIRSTVPHPASDAVTIVIGTIEDSMHTIELCSTDGRRSTLFRENLLAGTYAVSVDVSALPQGYYILELRSATLRATSPLVIVR